MRATGETRGSYAASTAEATRASEMAAIGASRDARRSSLGRAPTRDATHWSACSATRLPKRDLHRVKKSAGALVIPPRYRTRSASEQDARSFSITRLHRASIESAISCPTASSSALPARICRSSTASGVAGSVATSASIS